ncbi:MAG: hypothetical protein AAF742_04540, partial [Pseudomonadota bacterium]
QTQDGGFTREAFFNEICGVVSRFGSCNEKLTVDVARFDDFAALSADVSAPVCRDSDPTAGEPDPADMPYNTGAALDIIRVRVCFLYESVNPAIGLNLTPAGGGARKIISTNVFRNEPFGS